MGPFGRSGECSSVQPTVETKEGTDMRRLGIGYRGFPMLVGDY
jgi:hypothetical protein